VAAGPTFLAKSRLGFTTSQHGAFSISGLSVKQGDKRLDMVCGCRLRLTSGKLRYRLLPVAGMRATRLAGPFM
jgi:hypothetical protein